MTSGHIDQLAEWWENAEEGVINEGDRLIYRDGDDYDFRTAGREDAGTDAEKEHEHGWGIMSRAPKPKPAWHDARAVIASATMDDGGYFTGLWTREGDRLWESEEGICVHVDNLHDVTPLIEAKVTDAMIDRILDVIDARFDNYPAGIGEELAVAALGLETK